MNNKFIISIFTIAIINSSYCSERKLAKAIGRIKQKDTFRYKPNVNKADELRGFAKQNIPDPYNQRDAKWLALGYKEVALIKCNFLDFLYGYLGQGDSDCRYVLKNKDFCCASIETGESTINLVYSAKGRHNAFVLLRYALDLIDQGYKITQNTEDMPFEYLAGICLGYPLDDIDFYFQKSAFLSRQRKRGIWDRDLCDQKDELEQFLSDEWANSETCIQLIQAKQSISYWPEEHKDTNALQASIDNWRKNHPDAKVMYDNPLKNYHKPVSDKLRDAALHVAAHVCMFIFGID